MSIIKSIEECLELLNNPSVIFIDCRFNLANPTEGIEQYNQGHIPGAYYFDLEKDLSSIVSDHGGRHPLPDIDSFIEKLEVTGITNDKVVIAYDDQDGSMAARLWWLLQYIGHDQAAILGNNYRNWVNHHYPVSDKLPPVRHGKILPRINENMTVPMEIVKTQARSEENVVIDSRDPSRYYGETEPIDKKAGHIPGAENWYWKDNVKDGKWLSQAELQKRFSKLNKEKPITVYCGSGVTACANIVALKEAGFEKVTLYPGSWSDWVGYEENSIATKEK